MSISFCDSLSLPAPGLSVSSSKQTSYSTGSSDIALRAKKAVTQETRKKMQALSKTYTNEHILELSVPKNSQYAVIKHGDDV